MGPNNNTPTETLQTSAVLTKIWLTRFRGFHIHSMRRTPTAGLFGRIRYKNQWTLQKVTK